MLHGPCFDFFFVTGQLYTDKKAPKEIQSQAQGFIYLVTFGFGWLLGSLLAGKIVDAHVVPGGHNWHAIWLWPIGLVAGIIVFFSLGFHDRTRVGHYDDETVA